MPTDLALRTTLLDIEPPVWRRLRMPAGSTLVDLHAALQATFGWHNRGLHEITTFDGLSYTDRAHDPDAPEEVLDGASRSLRDALPQVGDRLNYEYHFNDEWEVDVVRERDPHGAAVARPFLVDAARASPPEDCGGPEEYLELLAGLADPAHSDHRDARESLPADWDAERCDTEAIRARLRALPAVGMQAPH